MFSDPQHNVAQMRLQPGMSVADFGAGSGEYSRAAAGMVGAAGKVYAIEIQQEIIPRVQSEFEEQGQDMVQVVWGDIEVNGGTRLKDVSIDAGILANVLFQLEDKSAALREISRVLKPGGTLLVVDWTDSFENMGPEAASIVTEDVAKDLCTGAGFTIEATFDAGDHHYGFIAKKT